MSSTCATFFCSSKALLTAVVAIFLFKLSVFLTDCVLKENEFPLAFPCPTVHFNNTSLLTPAALLYPFCLSLSRSCIFFFAACAAISGGSAQKFRRYLSGLMRVANSTWETSTASSWRLSVATFLDVHTSVSGARRYNLKQTVCLYH